MNIWPKTTDYNRISPVFLCPGQSTVAAARDAALRPAGSPVSAPVRRNVQRSHSAGRRRHALR